MGGNYFEERLSQQSRLANGGKSTCSVKVYKYVTIAQCSPVLLLLSRYIVYVSSFSTSYLVNCFADASSDSDSFLVFYLRLLFGDLLFR